MARSSLVRVVLVLVVWVVASAAAVAPAGALPPAPRAATSSLPFGDPVTLSVRTESPAERVRIRLSGATQLDPAGWLTGAGLWLDVAPRPTAQPGVLAWTAPRGSILHRRPGAYAWQVLTTTPQGVHAGPVESFALVLPRSATRRERLYPRYGRRGSGRLAVSSTGLPPEVSRGRFAKLAAETARRWGIAAGTSTTARAGAVDGVDVVGFSDAVGPESLGVQVDVLERRFRRAQRCGPAGCASVLEPAGSRVVERDVALRAGVAWHAEDGPPPLDRVDLETALLHELGHLAGNKGHVGRCVNSPLLESLAPGEWWRGPRDRWVHCPTRASAATARVGGAGARAAGVPRGFEHRVVIRRRVI